MAVSLAGSISRAISGYNKDIRTQERAISTGKKTLSQLKPADLVQISSLFRATQGLGGARANIDIAISKLNTLANGIQNQLDIVNKAYQLAETVVTNVNLTLTDQQTCSLQYRALVGPGGAYTSATNATTDINGTPMIALGAGLQIDAIVSTDPAAPVSFGPIDSTQGALFQNQFSYANDNQVTLGLNNGAIAAAVAAADAGIVALGLVAGVNGLFDGAVNAAAAGNAAAALALPGAIAAGIAAYTDLPTLAKFTAVVNSQPGPTTAIVGPTVANSVTLATAQMTCLGNAQGILSNYLASIENQIDLLSSISDSLGDASDAASDTAKEIADTDPIEAANAIKNNQGAKNLLAGLLTNDAQDANNVMNYARGILALPV